MTSSNAVAVAIVGIACGLGGGIGMRDSSSQSASMTATVAEYSEFDLLVSARYQFMANCWLYPRGKPARVGIVRGERRECGEAIGRFEIRRKRDEGGTKRRTKMKIECRLALLDATKEGTVGGQMRCRLRDRSFEEASRDEIQINSEISEV